MYAADDDDDDEAVTPVPTGNTTSNGLMNGDGVSDELVEWLSSCDAAQDDVLHKVSINNRTL